MTETGQDHETRQQIQLTDPDYLRQLAELHVTQFDQARDRPADLPALRRHLGRLDQERVLMVRQLARDDQLHVDALNAALADIDSERDELSQVLRQAEDHEQTRHLLAHVPERIPALVSQAQERLANPTLEVMAQIFDVLEIDLHRHGDGTRFEGTGFIPILEEGDNPFGEVGEGGPQPRYSNLAGLEFPLEVTA